MKRRCAGCNAVIDGRPDKLYCSRACEARVHRNRRKLHGNRVGLGPVETIVEGSNGVLIATVARLGYLGEPGDVVLDTTYGRGGWWTVQRPPGLVRTISDFRCLPHPTKSIKVVCYDPPYISTGNRATSTVDELYDRYGLGEDANKGWQATRMLIYRGLIECARILAPGGYLLVKCMDYVESGRKVFNTFWVVGATESLGLRLVDRFHHVTGGGPQPANNLDGSPRQQKHAREVASMLLVFSK